MEQIQQTKIALHIFCLFFFNQIINQKAGLKFNDKLDYS